MSDIYFKCIGSLTILGGALAYRMSDYRVAGSPGEDVEDSPLNRTYEAQMLTAEWNPVGTGLMLALYLKHPQLNEITRLVGTTAAIAFTVSRFLFVARYWMDKKYSITVGMPTMITTYLATFTMAGLLMIA